jgi:dihydroxyacetone kinase
MIFAFKCAGAEADQGARLTKWWQAAREGAGTHPYDGVALSPCTVPRAGKPTFMIGEGEMEIGMGIHGEPGMKREALQSADAIRTERMVLSILEDIARPAGSRVAVMVNGLGATPPKSCTSSTAGCTSCCRPERFVCTGPMWASMRRAWRWPGRRSR